MGLRVLASWFGRISEIHEYLDSGYLKVFVYSP